MFAAAKHAALAVLTILVVGSLAVSGVAGGAGKHPRDSERPSTPANVRVAAATSDRIRIAWDRSIDNVKVVGYTVYSDGQSTRVNGRSYDLTSLRCGESSAIGVAAFDRAGNRSRRVFTVISAPACGDRTSPSAPGGFVQRVTTPDAVVLSWNPSTDDVGVVGYTVYRGFAPVVRTAEPIATLTGMRCGSTTAYGVDAVDAAANRSRIGSVVVSTAPCGDSTPPSTPTSLRVESRTASALALAWKPSSDDSQVSGYRVLVDAEVRMVVTGTSAVVPDLRCETSYQLSIEAYDPNGNLSPAASTTEKTAGCASSSTPSADTTPPSAPTGLKASAIAKTHVRLSWSPSTDNVGVAAYDLYRNEVKVASGTATSTTHGALTCGTAYTFGVAARDAAANVSGRPELTVSTAACANPAPTPPAPTPTPTPTPPPPPAPTPPPPPSPTPTPPPAPTPTLPPAPTPPPTDTTAPTAPTNVRVTGSTATTIGIGWAAATDNVGVTAYQVFVNGAASPSVSTAQLGATVANLTCGTGYNVEVAAADAAGNRSQRAPVTGSTAACQDTQPPTVPANLVATSRTATSIALGWSASSDNVGVAGYGLYRGGTRVGSSSTTSGVFSGLTCNTNYTLAVDAYDAAGRRSAQATVMVATTACPDTTAPTAPANLAASNVTQSGLTLTWAPSSDNVGVAAYDVFRNGTLMASVQTTSASQTALGCGTAFTFAVAARDAAGNSSARTQISASTAACPAPAPPAPTPPPAPAPAPAPSPGPGLKWSRPALSNPTTVDASNSNRVFNFEDGKDYIVRMPSTPLTARGGLVVKGGRNVLIVGGEIRQDVQYSGGGADQQYGIYTIGQTGTLHIEGMLIHGAGLGQGIVLSQGNGATVQVQNTRIETLHPVGAVHTDGIQSWAGPRQLRVYNVTIRSTGLSIQVQPYEHWSGTLGQWEYERVNMEHLTNAAPALNKSGGPWWPEVHKNFWLKPNPNHGHPVHVNWQYNPAGWNPGGSAGTITGESLNIGAPPGGDFVPASSVGLAYPR